MRPNPGERSTVAPFSLVAPDAANQAAEAWTDKPDRAVPVLIAAFEGWNDAADAASGAVDHLMREWDATVVAAIDPRWR